MVGPQAQTKLCFFVIADGRENGGAKILGHLNSGVSDTARTPMDEDAFTRLKASTIDQICPNRKKILRNRRTACQIEASG